MQKTRRILAALAILLPASTGALALDLARSGFDTGLEDWSIFSDGTDLSWLPSGGNPDGYIRATDITSGQTWYFAAPVLYLGDKGSAYGGTLGFDLKQSSTNTQFNASDVVLIGGGQTLVYDTTPNPGIDWTSYTVPIGAGSGWKIGTLTGADATAADFANVLGSLTALRIRGEYRTGADQGSLDNVVLTSPVPEPATALLMLGGLVGLAAFRRRLTSP